MPDEQGNKASRIKWNEVTWYSRLGAIVLFLGVIPILAFYIGEQFQAIQPTRITTTFVGALSSPAPLETTTQLQTDGSKNSTYELSAFTPDSIQPAVNAPSDFNFDYQDSIYEINTSTGMLYESQGEGAPRSSASYHLSQHEMDIVYSELYKLGVLNSDVQKPDMDNSGTATGTLSLSSINGCSGFSLTAMTNGEEKKLAGGCDPNNAVPTALYSFMEYFLTPIFQNNLPPYSGPMSG